MASASTAGAEKNRGGLKAWTNEEQKRWLTEKLPAYRTSRGSNHPGEFWPPVYEEWFEEWPITVDEGETGDKAEILAQLMVKRKEQIRYWFKNHKGGGAPAGEGQSRVLDLTGKSSKNRKLSGANAYSKLYFAERVKPVLERRWREEYLKKNPGHGNLKLPRWKIKFQNKILHEVWDAEPENVKNEVRKKFGLRLDGDDSDDSEEETEAPQDERVARAKGYQTNIDCLPRTMSKALAELEKQTGLIGTILLAGPEPGQGGNITVFEFHRGRSQNTGEDFGRVYRDFVEHVRKPFHDFASRTFTPAARAKLALPGTENMANYQVPNNDDAPAQSLTINSSDDTGLRTSDRLKTASSSNKLAAPESPTITLSDDAGLQKSHRLKTATSSNKSAGSLRELDEDEDQENEGHAQSKVPETADVVENRIPRTRPLSEYEQRRQENIKRNEALLRGIQDAHDDLMEDINSRPPAKAKTGLRKKKGMNDFSESLVEQISTAVEQADGVDDAPASTAVGPSTSGDSTSATIEQAGNAVDAPTSAEVGPSMSGESASVLQDLAVTSTDDAERRDKSPDLSPGLTGATGSAVNSGFLGSDVDRSSWPEWMKKQISSIEGSPVMAGEFRLVLKKFVELETLLGFPKGQGRDYLLDKTGRPEEIGRWINSGRKGSPHIQDFARYVAAWKTWWISLQPGSREKRKLLRVVDAGEKWEELRKGSINGFFNIIISLVWWYAAIKNPAQSKVHREVVEDVSWVLGWMLDVGKDRKDSKKRAGGSSNEATKTKRARAK